MTKLNLKIINLDGVYLQKEIDMLIVKTTAGELGILHNHQPLITNIEISKLTLKNENVYTDYAIAGGTLFVNEEGCKIITSAIESQSEIDIQRAKRARDRAKKRLDHPDISEIDLKRAEIALKRALNRLSLSE